MRFEYFLWTLNHFEINDLTRAYEQLKTDNEIRFWFKASDGQAVTADTVDNDALFVFEKPNEIVLMGKASLKDILEVANPTEFAESMEAEITDFFTLPTTLATQQALGTLGSDIESIISNLKK